MSVTILDFEGGSGPIAADPTSGFSSVTIGAGSLTYDTAHPFHGTKTMKVAPVSGVATFGQVSALNTPQLGYSFYMWVDSATPAADQWLSSGNDTTGAVVFKVIMASTGKLRLQLNGATNIYQSVNNIPTGQWVRVSLYVAKSTNGTDGTIRLDYYLGNSTTPVETGYAAVGTAATGTLNIDNFRVGKVNASTATNAVSYDVVRYDPAATAQLGPYVAVNTAPTATISGNQNKGIGDPFTATVIASDPDGSIASYAWTVAYSSTTAPTLAGASTATVSGTSPSSTGQLVILQCVVTDNEGGTVTLTTEVRVPSSSTTVSHLPGTNLVDAGTLFPVTGAASAGDALADSSDTTYIESPTISGTTTKYRSRLRPMTERSALTVAERTQLTALGGTIEVRLLEGATVRQVWALPQSTAITDSNNVVTAPATIDAIVDWCNLWIEWAVTS